VLADKRYEILDGLPTYGPMYVSITHTGLPFYSQGFVVKFFKSDGTSWVANFEGGWTEFSAVYDFPRHKRTVVFAYGECYIMCDDEEKPLDVFGVDFSHVFQSSDNNTLIAVGNCDVTIIDVENDSNWRSDRISLDGFENLQFTDDCLTGLALDFDYGGKWLPFSMNCKTKEIVGGPG